MVNYTKLTNRWIFSYILVCVKRGAKSLVVRFFKTLKRYFTEYFINNYTFLHFLSNSGGTVDTMKTVLPSGQGRFDCDGNKKNIF